MCQPVSPSASSTLHPLPAANTHSSMATKRQSENEGTSRRERPTKATLLSEEIAACMGADGTIPVAWLMQRSEGTDQVFRDDRTESVLIAKFGMQQALERFLVARLDKLLHVVADAFIATVESQRHNGLCGAPLVPLRN